MAIKMKQKKIKAVEKKLARRQTHLSSLDTRPLRGGGGGRPSIGPLYPIIRRIFSSICPIQR